MWCDFHYDPDPVNRLIREKANKRKVLSGCFTSSLFKCLIFLLLVKLTLFKKKKKSSPLTLDNDTNSSIADLHLRTHPSIYFYTHLAMIISTHSLSDAKHSDTHSRTLSLIHTHSHILFICSSSPILTNIHVSVLLRASAGHPGHSELQTDHSRLGFRPERALELRVSVL